MPHPSLIDCSGQRFTRLLVLRRAADHIGPKRRYVKWLCHCDCGQFTEVRTAALRKGSTQSCGCLMRERVSAAAIRNKTTHGLSGSALNLIHRNMIYRTKNGHGRDRGYRAIKVCAKWQDFMAFRTWALANGYKPGGSVQRRNKKRDYCPSNCVVVLDRSRRGSGRRKKVA